MQGYNKDKARVYLQQSDILTHAWVCFSKYFHKTFSLTESLSGGDPHKDLTFNATGLPVRDSSQHNCRTLPKSTHTINHPFP